LDWTDDAIVLSAQRHGENSLVVTLLTASHGRHAGLVRGGQSARSRGTWQTGNRVLARWGARLAEHLGTLSGELAHSPLASLLDEPDRLAALAAAAAMADVALPDREPCPGAYESFDALLHAIERQLDWAEQYVAWELALLGELGFGLDLSRCAATGTADDLAFVSPKSGRAVSREAGQPYADKLLPLPRFLAQPEANARAEPASALIDGLFLTGYFLRHHVLHDRPLPAARERLVDRLRRMIAISAGGSSVPDTISSLT
jgi:DNA repair protein RecO (recombination protein O)